jgi:ferritin-like metal-binding protein YciE
VTHHGGRLQERLVDYLQDAHVMERNSLLMLKSMLSHTQDPETRQMLEHHVEETEQHESRLRSRLEALGEGTSKSREGGALLGSMFKGVLDQVRSEKPSKDARDGYLTEQLEIASYELLQRLAHRAGDNKTAEIARLNLKDERAMAEKIASSWDKVIDLTLEEAGLHV